MNESAQNTQTPPPSIAKRVVRFIHYPFAIAAGYLFAKSEVENSIYNNLQKTEKWRAMTDQHTKDLDVAIEKGIVEGIPAGKATKAIRQAYSEKLVEQYEKRGLTKFSQKIEFAHQSQLNKAAIEGVTVLALVLAGGDAVSKYLLSLLNEKESGRDR